MATVTTVHTIIRRQACRATQLPSFNNCAIRTFYTYKIPINAPRVELDDGSILIHKPKPQTLLSDEALLPPLLYDWAEPHKRLTREQITEARRLREEDPDRWTVSELAQRYEIPPKVMKHWVTTPKERREFLQHKEQQKFDRSSTMKKVFLIERERRKSLW
ncbi:hypothetical protein HDV00_008860 [Rhizophlyctis rosea]|nr:hypothetical protein HDV00_008860 [Rhizophlyctis rosea]